MRSVDIYFLPPNHPLREFVFGVWRTRDVRGSVEHVFPRGVVDLLFPMTGDIGLIKGPSSAVGRLRPGPYLSGLQTRAIQTQCGPKFIMLGLSLRAEFARAVTAVPADEIANRTIEAALVLPNAVELFDQLSSTDSFPQQCRMLLRWVEASIQPSRYLMPLGRACQVLSDSGEGSVRDLSQEMCVSERHFRRLFHEYVGLSPSEYIRLQRFNRAIDFIRSPKDLTWIAQDAGYYDQAHLCRDFKAISGMTPGEYRDSATLVDGHLFSSDVRLIQFQHHDLG